VFLFNKKYLNNIFISGLPGVLSIFLSFFSIPIFLNLLSTEYYANFLIQHSILTLGMVLNLNLGKFASIKIQKVSFSQKKQIIFTSFIASFLIGSLLSALTYFIFLFFFEDKNFFNISLSLFFGLFITILYINIEYIIKSLGYFRLYSFSNFLFYSISLSLPAFFLLIDNQNLNIKDELFMISLYVKYFAFLCLLLYLILKNDLILTKINLRLFNEFKVHSKWMTVNAFYNQIYDYIDKYLIKITLGSIMLVSYVVPQLIAAKLTIFSHAIIAVLLPKLSIKKNDTEYRKILSANLYLFISLMGLTLIILLPFYSMFLSWWLKGAYNLEILKIFKLFTLLTFLGCFSNIIVAFYEARLMSKKNTKYESVSIIPFCFGLILCVYYKNIFLFAFLLLFKDFIMLFIRLEDIKRYIVNFKLFNSLILLFFLAHIFSFFNYFDIAYIFSFIFFLLLIIGLPRKIIKKEFF